MINHTESSIHLQLSNQERGYYSSLFGKLSPQFNPISSKQVVQLFKQSNLSIQQLKEIWIMSCSHDTEITRDEFYVALKYIAMAQQNIPLNYQNLQKPLALAQFNKNFDKNYYQQIYESQSWNKQALVIYLEGLGQGGMDFVEKITSNKITLNDFLACVYLVVQGKEELSLGKKLPEFVDSLLQNQQQYSTQNTSSKDISSQELGQTEYPEKQNNIKQNDRKSQDSVIMNNLYGSQTIESSEPNKSAYQNNQKQQSLQNNNNKTQFMTQPLQFQNNENLNSSQNQIKDYSSPVLSQKNELKSPSQKQTTIYFQDKVIPSHNENIQILLQQEKQLNMKLESELKNAISQIEYQDKLMQQAQLSQNLLPKFQDINQRLLNQNQNLQTFISQTQNQNLKVQSNLMQLETTVDRLQQSQQMYVKDIDHFMKQMVSEVQDSTQRIMNKIKNIEFKWDKIKEQQYIHKNIYQVEQEVENLTNNQFEIYNSLVHNNYQQEKQNQIQIRTERESFGGSKDDEFNFNLKTARQSQFIPLQEQNLNQQQQYNYQFEQSNQLKKIEENDIFQCQFQQSEQKINEMSQLDFFGNQDSLNIQQKDQKQIIQNNDLFLDQNNVLQIVNDQIFSKDLDQNNSNENSNHSSEYYDKENVQPQFKKLLVIESPKQLTQTQKEIMDNENIIKNLTLDDYNVSYKDNIVENDLNQKFDFNISQKEVQFSQQVFYLENQEQQNQKFNQNDFGFSSDFNTQNNKESYQNNDFLQDQNQEKSLNNSSNDEFQQSKQEEFENQLSFNNEFNQDHINKFNQQYYNQKKQTSTQEGFAQSIATQDSLNKFQNNNLGKKHFSVQFETIQQQTYVQDDQFQFQIQENLAEADNFEFQDNFKENDHFQDDFFQANEKLKSPNEFENQDLFRKEDFFVEESPMKGFQNFDELDVNNNQKMLSVDSNNDQQDKVEFNFEF